MAAGGGGAWKVAYADFVTAMMAFFMVMWLTSQSDEVKHAIGGYFQDPWGSASERTTPSIQSATGVAGEAPFADTPAGIMPNRSPQADVENATSTEPGAASVWQQQHKIHMLADRERDLPALVVNFDDASAELPQVAQQRLRDLLPAIKGKRHKIELRSHSTRKPLPPGSPFADHWQLCYARSVATMQFLENQGVEPDRMRLSQSAAFEPLPTRFETAWQEANDCVEVYLLTEIVDNTPGVTDSHSSAETRKKQADHGPSAKPNTSKASHGH